MPKQTNKNISKKKIKQSYKNYLENIVNNYTNKHYNIIKFNGLRKFIKERDNYKCRNCFITEEEHYIKYGKGLTIHHLDGNGIFSEKINNDPNNLITLCLSCHGKLDTLRKPVVQISLNGDIIAIYKSQSDAAISVNAFPTHICRVCNGKRKTCKGYKWHYFNNFK